LELEDAWIDKEGFDWVVARKTKTDIDALYTDFINT
jgi:hypothetical protein